MPNPYADGHFQALGYAYNHLLDKDFFPGKVNALSEKDISKSDASLFWLRDLHKKMLTSSANHSIFMQDEQNAILPHLLGKYRNSDATLSTRMAPHPSIIPNILHRWIIDLAGVHEKLGEKAKKQYGLNPDEAKELIDFARYTKMLFSTVQPMSYANNRFGRLLENILRLQWRLPWKDLNKAEYDKFILELSDFENQLPKIITSSQHPHNLSTRGAQSP